MLSGLGVREADRWLWPELEIWDWELQDQSDVWKSLHDQADNWLELWISKYKVNEDICSLTVCYLLLLIAVFLSLTKGQNVWLKTERLSLCERALHCSCCPFP